MCCMKVMFLFAKHQSLFRYTIYPPSPPPNKNFHIPFWLLMTKYPPHTHSHPISTCTQLLQYLARTSQGKAYWILVVIFCSALPANLQKEIFTSLNTSWVTSHNLNQKSNIVQPAIHLAERHLHLSSSCSVSRDWVSSHANTPFSLKWSIFFRQWPLLSQMGSLPSHIPIGPIQDVPVACAAMAASEMSDSSLCSAKHIFGPCTEG